MEVLVTGGAGLLGRAVVSRLLARGIGVRVLAPDSAAEVAGVRALVADPATGEGFEEAVAGVDAVVLARGPAPRREAAEGAGIARRLLEAVRAASPAAHVLLPSLVGADHHPGARFAAAREAEILVEKSGLRYTIQRATGLSGRLARSLDGLARLPVVPAPALVRLQPLDEGEFAGIIAAHVESGPAGRAEDVGGPEVMPASEAARAYLAASGRRRVVLPVPTVGPSGRAHKRGLHLASERAVGAVTWAEYVRRRWG